MNGNGALQSETFYTMTYNAGKLTKVDLKVYSGLVGAFTHHGTANLTYAGDNITKVVENRSGIYNGATPEPLDPAMNTTYKFEDFDSKINPYFTLPKEFGIMLGVTQPAVFQHINYNNALKFTMEFPMMPQPFVTQGVPGVYDAQNYLTGDASGVFKYHYKAIQ